MNATQMTIHTDGACSGNPGPGGFAAIIEWEPDGLITVSGGDPETTNNRMELSAVIEALRAVNFLPEWAEEEITVRTDSQYITKAFKEHWLDNWQSNGWRTAKNKPVENQDLWKALLEEAKGRRVTWEWVRGHSGDPMNERCDRLAVEQAQLARTQREPWTSAGNPASANNPAAGAEKSEKPGTIPFVPAERSSNYHAGYADGHQRGQAITPGTGYEECRREITTFLQNLDSGPPPNFKNYIDGYRDCRAELLEFVRRMSQNNTGF